jgi:hypothetical protein
MSEKRLFSLKSEKGLNEFLFEMLMLAYINEKNDDK